MAERPFWYTQRPSGRDEQRRARRGDGGADPAFGHRPVADRGSKRLGVQVLEDLLHVLIPQGEVDDEAALDDLLQVRRKLGVELLDRLRRALRPRHHDLERGRAAEGNRAGGHLVEDHAEREDVGLRADRLALDLLGRHVERRADDRARLRHSRLLGGLGQAEVGDVHVIGGVDHDVLGLQVAVDDALVVRGLEAFRRLAEDAQEALGRQLALLLQDRGQVPPVDELHRQELDAVALAEIEDAQDVGVRHAARELDLALEALEDLGVLGDVRPDELQRDVAVQALVVHEVDGAHSAHAEEALDAVPLADLEAGGQNDRGHAPLATGWPTA